MVREPVLLLLLLLLLPPLLAAAAAAKQRHRAKDKQAFAMMCQHFSAVLPPLQPPATGGSRGSHTHTPAFVVNVGLFGNGEVSLERFLNKVMAKYYAPADTPAGATAGAEGIQQRACSGPLSAGAAPDAPATSVGDLVQRTVHNGGSVEAALRRRGCAAVSYLGSVHGCSKDAGGLPCAGRGLRLRLRQVTHFASLERALPGARFVMLQRSNQARWAQNVSAGFRGQGLKSIQEADIVGLPKGEPESASGLEAWAARHAALVTRYFRCGKSGRAAFLAFDPDNGDPRDLARFLGLPDGAAALWAHVEQPAFGLITPPDYASVLSSRRPVHILPKSASKLQCDVPCYSSASKRRHQTTDLSTGHQVVSTMEAPAVRKAHPRHITSSTSLASDVPVPYFQWTQYFLSVGAPVNATALPNALFIANNCNSTSGREAVVMEMRRAGMGVDGISGCLNNKQVPAADRLGLGHKLRWMSNYMFYLAFENTVQDDYITEKLWYTYMAGAIPVYLGARNIADHAPPHSYIAVADFGSTADLVAHLQGVAANATLRATYHAWRRDPTEVVGTQYNVLWKPHHCRLCTFASHHPLSATLLAQVQAEQRHTQRKKQRSQNLHKPSRTDAASLSRQQAKPDAAQGSQAAIWKDLQKHQMRRKRKRKLLDPGSNRAHDSVGGVDSQPAGNSTGGSKHPVRLQRRPERGGGAVKGPFH